MSAGAADATWVVPCFNEGGRLDADAFSALAAAEHGARLLFVDDGSRDDTPKHLRNLQVHYPSSVDVLTLTANQGKAEAVRQGLIRAAAAGAGIVGYFDADLATPPSEIQRLLRIMREGRAEVLLASRVALLGRSINRSAPRHYLGRLFASAASVILELPVYDTQCGAKLFRNGAALSSALHDPFLSRWVFDVELLGRLLAGNAEVAPIDVASVLEEPLLQWRDVPGSNLTAIRMARAGLDLARIARDLRCRRARS